MSINKKLLAIYAIFEISLLISSAFLGKAWFYSSQVAFFASLLILLATFRSYKMRVNSRVEHERMIMSDDEYDEEEDSEWGENFTDRTDDGRLIVKKHKKSDNNESEEVELELSPKEILQKERAAIKNLPKFRNLQTAFVPFRLIAYSVLVVGFLALNRQGNLDIVGFLLALGIMPMGAFIYGVIGYGDK